MNRLDRETLQEWVRQQKGVGMDQVDRAFREWGTSEDVAFGDGKSFRAGWEAALRALPEQAEPVAWIYRKYDTEKDVETYHVLWPGEEQHSDNDPMPVFERAASPDDGVVDMILYCPKCNTQHIDAPDNRTTDWKNPPHKSHLCHGCGHIWRPSDTPTNGVLATASGKDSDTKPPDGVVVPRVALQALRDWIATAYGDLPKDRPPGPPTGIIATLDALLAAPKGGE